MPGTARPVVYPNVYRLAKCPKFPGTDPNFRPYSMYPENIIYVMSQILGKGKHYEKLFYFPKNHKAYIIQRAFKVALG